MKKNILLENFATFLKFSVSLEKKLQFCTQFLTKKLIRQFQCKNL